MDPLAELVGESPAIEAVRDQIRRLVARLEVGRRLPAILISGETGLGKRAGRAHHSTARGHGPAGPSSTSTAWLSRTRCWKPSHLVSSVGTSPTRAGQSPASSRPHITGRSSLTRSDSCPSPSRPSFSRCSRRKPCDAWAPPPGTGGRVDHQRHQRRSPGSGTPAHVPRGSLSPVGCADPSTAASARARS